MPRTRYSRTRLGPPRIELRTVALIAVLAATGAVGCERAVFGPGHPTSDIGGYYDGTFFLEWDPVGPGRGGWDEGSGTLDIHHRHGSSFSGEWSWWLDGHWLWGDLDRGRHDRHRGDVSFELGVGFGHDLMEEVTGCRFLSGDRHFHGYAAGRRLEADRVGRFRCVDPYSGFGEDFVFRLSFSGWR